MTSSSGSDDGVECPSCGDELGTNAGCVECLYAFEAGVGPVADQDRGTGDDQ